MTFKVKIFTVLLFICLIDSLHSASYGRIKRSENSEEEHETIKLSEEEKEVVPPKTKEPEASVGNDSKPSPFDFNVLLQNLGQIVNKNNDWSKEFNTWFGRGK
ncbi:unnamed protein product [Arctia plantaginis]|uniref:Secreted protein n=1 Tax=Arctia plantaginis TaxID=874455 RepID=A0A8S0ZGS2_ARCPL|nr:unnamed protein product [Arctia plantaginis]CAB3234943.1 unnamed protein product [Arctia plantaginis]